MKPTRSSRLRSTLRASITVAMTFYWVHMGNAFACNGPPPPDVDNALRTANLVVVAQFVSTEQHPSAGDTSGRYTTEEALFQVVKALKGPYVQGDLIHIRSHLGPGLCGMSAKNNPVSIESIDQDGKPSAPTLSGAWLIYGYGTEPYDLDRLTRTKPMEFGGETEVEELRRFVSKPNPSEQPINRAPQ